MIQYKIWVHIEKVDEGPGVYIDQAEPIEVAAFETFKQAEDFREAMVEASTVLHAINSRTEERVIANVVKVGEAMHSFIRKLSKDEELQDAIKGLVESNKRPQQYEGQCQICKHEWQSNTLDVRCPECDSNVMAMIDVVTKDEEDGGEKENRS